MPLKKVHTNKMIGKSNKNCPSILDYTKIIICTISSFVINKK